MSKILFLKKIIKYIVNRFKKTTIYYKKKYKLSKIYQLENDLSIYDKSNSPGNISIIIFSKDRPVQLLALIESMKKFSEPYILPHIIYNASNKEYQKAYNELFKQYGGLINTYYNDEELGFKQQVIQILDEKCKEKIVFFVDDILFKEKFLWSDVSIYNCQNVVFSLRLGLDLNYCYTVDDKQSIPPYITHNNIVFWNWSEGDHDWSYPLSVDGHIFSKHDILNNIKEFDFNNPNRFEIELQKLNKQYNNKMGACFINSIIMNVPVNKVQSLVPNKYGSIHQNDLLCKWKEGKKIDYMSVAGFKNISAHQEIDYQFIDRI